MRLIVTFDTEKQAYVFYSFLLKEGVQNAYEAALDPKTQTMRYHLWVQDEDDLDRALEWLARYRKDPNDPLFQNIPLTLVAPLPVGEESADLKKQRPGWKVPIPKAFKRQRLSFKLTHFIIVLCVFLFVWNSVEESRILEEGGPLAAQLDFTPVQEALLFDYPQSFKNFEDVVTTIPLKSYKELKELPPDAQALIKKAEDAPMWKGVYSLFVTAHEKGWAVAEQIPLFEKIRQGEVWRLFTPCLLHSDFLHILFNMAWAWILGKQIEERIHKVKLFLMIVIIGIIANVAQYLVSGPYFLGFSGVAVGMAGFIWIRQKKAPWEGYPLNRGTILFLFFFVIAMLGLEIMTFGLRVLSVIQVTPNIANTAHIIGGLCGIALGRLRFFARGIP